MYLVSKPVIAQAVQVKTTVTQVGSTRRVEAHLGPLSEWVCVRNHAADAPPPPPQGFGDNFSAGGVPHVHTPTGLTALNEDLWLVVMGGQPYVMTDSDLWEMFQKVNGDFSPTVGDKQEWSRYKDAPEQKAIKP